jgi:hypothetical protein
MSFTVITNPNLKAKTGFTNAQFKKLDGLYLRAAAHKVLNYRTVDCDFDEGVATYTYFKSERMAPYIQFIIRKVGPNTMMYEVFKTDKGRIKKSGVFDIAYARLEEEIEGLL